MRGRILKKEEDYNNRRLSDLISEIHSEMLWLKSDTDKRPFLRKCAQRLRGRKYGTPHWKINNEKIEVVISEVIHDWNEVLQPMYDRRSAND